MPPEKSKAKNGKTKPQNGASLGFEAEMFLAADKLRGNLEPSEYKHVVLGLVFLKYISDAFEAKHSALLADDPTAAEDPDEYLAENVFWVPKAGSARRTPPAALIAEYAVFIAALVTLRCCSRRSDLELQLPAIGSMRRESDRMLLSHDPDFDFPARSRSGAQSSGFPGGD